MDAGCTDCDLQYHYSTYNLTLSLTSAGVTIGIDVKASSYVDIDFLMDLQMEANTGKQSNTSHRQSTRFPTILRSALHLHLRLESGCGAHLRHCHHQPAIHRWWV